MASESDEACTQRFLDELSTRLLDQPFFIRSAESEDEPRQKVRWLSDEEASERIGVQVPRLRRVLRAQTTSLRYGTFQYKRSWSIHPLDLPVIRELIVG